MLTNLCLLCRIYENMRLVCWHSRFVVLCFTHTPRLFSSAGMDTEQGRKIICLCVKEEREDVLSFVRKSRQVLEESLEDKVHFQYRKLRKGNGQGEVSDSKEAAVVKRVNHLEQDPNIVPERKVDLDNVIKRKTDLNVYLERQEHSFLVSDRHLDPNFFTSEQIDPNLIAEREEDTNTNKQGEINNRMSDDLPLDFSMATDKINKCQDPKMEDRLPDENLHKWFREVEDLDNISERKGTLAVKNYEQEKMMDEGNETDSTIIETESDCCDQMEQGTIRTRDEEAKRMTDREKDAGFDYSDQALSKKRAKKKIEDKDNATDCDQSQDQAGKTVSDQSTGRMKNMSQFDQSLDRADVTEMGQSRGTERDSHDVSQCELTSDITSMDETEDTADEAYVESVLGQVQQLCDNLMNTEYLLLMATKSEKTFGHQISSDKGRQFLDSGVGLLREFVTYCYGKTDLQSKGMDDIKEEMIQEESEHITMVKRNASKKLCTNKTGKSTTAKKKKNHESFEKEISDVGKSFKKGPSRAGKSHKVKGKQQSEVIPKGTRRRENSHVDMSKSSRSNQSDDIASRLRKNKRKSYCETSEQWRDENDVIMENMDEDDVVWSDNMEDDNEDDASWEGVDNGSEPEVSRLKESINDETWDSDYDLDLDFMDNLKKKVEVRVQDEGIKVKINPQKKVRKNVTGHESSETQSCDQSAQDISFLTAKDKQTTERIKTAHETLIKKAGSLSKVEKKILRLKMRDRRKWKNELKQTCTNCNEVFPTRKALLRHKRLKTCQTETFTCDLCGSNFMTLKNLMKHEGRQHTLKNEVAGKKKNEKKAKQIGKQMCVNCKEVFPTRKELLDHKRQSSCQTQILTCDLCGSTFTTLINLLKHKKRQHNLKKEVEEETKTATKQDNPVTYFSCIQCDLNFDSKVQLKIHQLSHRDSSLCCPLCGETFSDKSALEDHCQNHPLTNPNDTPESPKCLKCRKPCVSGDLEEGLCVDCCRDDYECPRCYQKYAYFYMLAMHDCNKQHDVNTEKILSIDFDTYTENLLCHMCSKEFKNKKNLCAHYKTSHYWQTRLECDVCLQLFKNSWTLSKHKRRTHSGKNYFCNKCEKVFRCKESLAKHLKSHDEMKSEDVSTVIKYHCCLECADVFDSIEVLRDHKTQKHTQQICCSVCDETFSNQKDYKEHCKTHPDQDLSASESLKCLNCKRVFSDHVKLEEGTCFCMECSTCEHTCSTCRQRYKYIFRLATHDCQKSFQENQSIIKSINFEKPNGSLVCGGCKKEYKNKKNLCSHYKAMHYIRTRVKCNLCSQLFKEQQGLNRHMKTVHGTERNFICDICGKAFKQNYTLQSHRKIHDGPTKEFQCDICGKFLCSKAGLVTHKKNHDGILAFVCEICGQAFSQKSNMLNHMLVHGDSRDYSCEICQQAFKYRSCYTIHMKKHVLKGDIKQNKYGKIYECPHCHKKIPSASTYKVHIRTHTNERPYECSMCDSKFKERGKLNRHLQNTHKELGAVIIKRKRSEYAKNKKSTLQVAQDSRNNVNNANLSINPTGIGSNPVVTMTNMGLPLLDSVQPYCMGHNTYSSQYNTPTYI